MSAATPSTRRGASAAGPAAGTTLPRLSSQRTRSPDPIRYSQRKGRREATASAISAATRSRSSGCTPPVRLSGSTGPAPRASTPRSAAPPLLTESQRMETRNAPVARPTPRPRATY
jgi:hypothetical protein